MELDHLTQIETWQALGRDVLAWAEVHLFTVDASAQVVVFLAAFMFSGWLGKKLNDWFDVIAKDWEPYRLVEPFLETLIRPIAALIILRTGVLILGQIPYQTVLLVVASSLLTAWIIIRFASNFILKPAVSRAFAGMAWTIAALKILGYLDAIVEALRNFGITLGGTRITAYAVITGVLTAVILLWGASALARFGENRLQKMTALDPSLKVLFSKVARIVLMAGAVLIALASAGIDLTAFAVFSGALGVGLGFGLQKVVSNFVSGIILLLDRSIKPGDVIEVGGAGGTYGWINALAARYTSVVTRDGTEYLIPNEDMITRPVINWSHSDRNVRRRIPVQVAYSSDVRLAMRLMEEAAAKVERILDNPAPRTLIRGFGSDGVDLELRMWIDDPYNGVSNVGSEVMGHIWDLFHEHGIEFPFPQRDLHLNRTAIDGLKEVFPAEKTAAAPRRAQKKTPAEKPAS